MNTDHLVMTIGVVVVFLALLVAVFVLGKKKRETEQYDERQIMIRGKGYKISFMTVIAMLFLYGGVLYAYTKDIVAPQFVVMAIAFLGILVFIIYCIFQDAYVQVGQSPKGWVFLVLFIAAINTISAFQSTERGFDKDGIATAFSMNVLLVVFFCSILIAMLVKKVIDRRGKRHEES